jgi:hypothetical protein
MGATCGGWGKRRVGALPLRKEIGGNISAAVVCDGDIESPDHLISHVVLCGMSIAV